MTECLLIIYAIIVYKVQFILDYHKKHMLLLVNIICLAFFIF